jgi:hypothetical protein
METLQTLQYSPGSVDPLRSFVHQGRLMAPHEVTESFIRRGQFVPPELKSHWSLCGEMTDAMFDEVEASAPSKLALRMSSFTTTHGGFYLVLTHQISLRQHRFVLPLWDTSVLAGVRAMAEGKLKFMLAHQTGEMAVVFSSGFKPHEVEPVLAYEIPDDTEQLLALFAEMPAVVETLRQLQAVPTCGCPGPIQEAALSVVVPFQAALSLVRGTSSRQR